MDEHADPLRIATEVFKDVFNSGSYSSLGMISAIAINLGLSERDILEKPENLKGFDQNSITQENLYQSPISSTWSLKTGRCTSFALKVVHQLESQHPELFNFKYFDLKGHRVARCQRTGILIDSSSGIGAVILNESQDWSTITGLTGKWMFYNDVLTYERSPQQGIKRSSPITAEKAIGTCLGEVAKKAILVCLFREFEARTTQFRGMIKWNIKDKRVELIPDLDDRKRMMTIAFCPQGTEESAQLCTSNFGAFIKKYGDMNQWVADDTHKIHETFWNAAVKLWGSPIWSSAPEP
ncbi:hypothetical protein GGR54DRAFT_640445 [Hypoxylon sp. NC1633]|nr:hypothetical protein GGR54DRAFT_640445 [Hypoxylon sp. NC1633]